ncbi:hypothetical protein H6P81_000402 [Aristolochia fimbriata]|uniref:Uncharacterized protein n=1 Tax=Aristolochia fimbriata TaxID=158543 RepID=A0AAV7F4R3_ARIFI|nr:hypothetical protein H6P81_000402 [Aristolochia fimbriata]
MEFRYRAGEEKPLPYKSQGGDGYFTSQPLRATYVTGDDLRRRDSLLQSYLPCPSPTDALRRVLEKERIREEIIAREILLRRELEEEIEKVRPNEFTLKLFV